MTITTMTTMTIMTIMTTITTMTTKFKLSRAMMKDNAANDNDDDGEGTLFDEKVGLQPLMMKTMCLAIVIM